MIYPSRGATIAPTTLHSVPSTTQATTPPPKPISILKRKEKVLPPPSNFALHNNRLTMTEVNQSPVLPTSTASSTQSAVLLSNQPSSSVHHRSVASFSRESKSQLDAPENMNVKKSKDDVVEVIRSRAPHSADPSKDIICSELSNRSSAAHQNIARHVQTFAGPCNQGHNLAEICSGF